MLLAPAPRRAAARGRRAAARRARTLARRAAPSGSRSPAPASSTSSSRIAGTATAVAALLDAGDAFGRGTPERPERVLVEFVSANPTGPLTVAARPGRRLRRLAGPPARAGGPPVEREYLLNDVGGQVRAFAESIAARMQGARAARGRVSQASTSAELAGELAAAGADPADLDELGQARARRRCATGSRRPSSASGSASTPGSRSAPCTRRGKIEAAIAASARARPRLRQRGRRLAADQRASATTRTGCWSAPTASRPTSPPTSPTTATSSSGAPSG